MIQPGYFEARAIAGKAQRLRERTEFSSDELEPIQVVEMTKADLANMKLPELKELLKRDRAIFLFENEAHWRSRKNAEAHKVIFAMLTPVHWSYLLEIRDVLRDTTRYQVVDRGAAAEELGIGGAP